jgi:O-antigen/teichoic acid export membrane protein
MASEWWVVIGWATYAGAIEAAAVAPAVSGLASLIYILRLPKILGKAGFEQELGGYSLAAQAVVPVHMLIAASNLHVGPEMGERFRAGGLAEMRRHLFRVRLSYVGVAIVPGVAVLLGLPL